MSVANVFQERVREVCARSLPLPGSGETALRHAMLFAIGEEDLSLAKIAEAHFDAIAILAEACEAPAAGAVYAVWASELAGQALSFFADAITHDPSAWHTEACRLTQTGAVRFSDAPVERVVDGAGFYLERPGFWNGACGPAACWAGGAAGLLHFVRQSKRNDPHTVAHRAAIESNVWAMRALLTETGQEIDAAPSDTMAAHVRALRLRHLVERLATDTLDRFARAYGPQPLAMDEEMSRRSAELGLFLRQCHGERDLEALGRAL